MERRFIFTFLSIFLIGSTLILGALWFVYSAEKKTQRVRIETKEIQLVKLQRVRLAAHFHGITSDLKVIANLHELRKLADNLSDFSVQDVKSDFLSFSIQKGQYDQIRFIDKDGMEVVRIDYNRARPEIVPKHRLQSKSNRYYFKDTMSKQEHQIYISELDLNVENRQVERPFKPMIRFGTPIFNSRRHKVGMIILNYAANLLISDFKSLARDGFGENWILNSEGYWLSGTSPDDEWGFMFEHRKDISLKRRIPEVWQAISEKTSGEFYHTGGLYTFDTFHSAKEANSEHLYSKELHQKELGDASTNSWKIVSFIPNDVLNAELRKHSNKLLDILKAIFVFLVTLNGLTAFMLAKAQQKRRGAEETLKQHNIQLEETVLERTLELKDKNERLKLEISERIQTEESLRRVQDLLVEAQRLANLGSWEYDLVTKKLNWSKEVYSIFGLDQTYTPSLKGLAELIHPDDLWVIAPETIEKNTNTGIQEIEYRIIDQASKKIKYVIERRETLKDHKNNPVKNFGSLQDITERKKAEDQIKDSEKKYRIVFENAAVGVAQINTQTGQFVKINQKYCDIIGYETGELTTTTFMEITHPDDLDVDLMYMNKLKAGEIREFSMEKRYFHKNGELVWINLTVSPMWDLGEQPSFHIAIVESITDRKHSEAKLRRHSQVIEQSGSTIVITDSKGKIEYVNPAFSKTSGYSFEEAISQNPRILNSGEHSAQFFEKMWNTLSNGETWRGEMINKRKSGELYWEFATISPVKDDSGRTTHYVAIKDDKSLLKKAEEALKESEKQKKTILETTIEGFWLIDNEALTMDVNESMCEILGRTREEIAGKSVLDFYDKMNAELIQKELENRNKGISSTYEASILHTNGKMIPCLFNANPLYDADGNKQGSFAMVTDISERKRNEENLEKAKREADIANQSKSEFLANMSHELRTPLNSVIGFSQVLENQLTNTLTDKQKTFFNYIKTSGDHLLEMVNDILDLSKIEAGKIELDLKPFDFGHMINRSTSIIKEDAYKKKLQIDIEIPPDLGWINGDETRLKQVVFNLLSNAVKFTERGKRIGIDASIEGDNFIVEVWDKGMGILENNLEKIFDPFEQGKGGKVSSEKGTGLGLSISRRLIELHQGTITATSKVGEGSRFIINLPGRFLVEEQPGEERAVRQTEVITYSKKRFEILVTEDNKNNRKLINAALDGYNLEYAITGEEAVTKVSEKEYDLILMDIQLPGIDGTEAMKQIRKIRIDNKPIFALTAFAMKGDEEKYLEAGFDDYISKPINIENLIQKIEHILG